MSDTINSLVDHHCQWCDKSRKHIVLKPSGASKEPQYRCTNCGTPRRHGKKNAFKIRHHMHPEGLVMFEAAQ